MNPNPKIEAAAREIAEAFDSLIKCKVTEISVEDILTRHFQDPPFEGEKSAEDWIRELRSEPIKSTTDYLAFIEQIQSDSRRAGRIEQAKEDADLLRNQRYTNQESCIAALEQAASQIEGRG